MDTFNHVYGMNGLYGVAPSQFSSLESTTSTNSQSSQSQGFPAYPEPVSSSQTFGTDIKFFVDYFYISYGHHRSRALHQTQGHTIPTFPLNIIIHVLENFRKKTQHSQNRSIR